MIRPDHKLAIYVQNALKGEFSKLGLGVLRYSQNPIVAVIDSSCSGEYIPDIAKIERDVPIVSSVAEAAGLGAEVMVLGIAPPGGAIPDEWYTDLDQAVSLGLSVANGLHDQLAGRYPNLEPGQFIWDIRKEPEGLVVGRGKAAQLSNKRLLLIGTDMSVGKMTAGLEIHKAALQAGTKASFVATGQVGITITGKGVPLDAIRLDFASGAIEREVMDVADSDLIIVEGQGSLCHPSSTANLPLLRGSCPTHLILCARAGQTHLRRVPEIKIPPLGEFIRLYEALASACGTFPTPQTVGVCLNTFHISSDEEALDACASLGEELGLPCVDPVRHGASALLSF